MSESWEFALGMASAVVAVQLPVYALGWWLIRRQARRLAAQFEAERQQLIAQHAQEVSDAV